MKKRARYSRPIRGIPAGSWADVEAEVDIKSVYNGYFSNPVVTESFIRVGIAPIARLLPPEIVYADLGGDRDIS